MPFDKNKYDQEYNKTHIRRKFIPFNDTNPDDCLMLEWLATKPNVTQYIKSLIMADWMANSSDSLSDRLSDANCKPQDD